MQTVVTTGGRPDDNARQRAFFASTTLNIPFVERQKRSMKKLMEQEQANVLVAGKHRYEYYAYGQREPFFFHPSSAAFRAKRMARGEIDTFVDVTGLQQGDAMLDCTLGMATDSMLAAMKVGQTGRIVGCEGNEVIAFVMAQGLKEYNYIEENLPQLAVMRHIEVVSSIAVDYLKTLPAESFDVVYMDPMFEETIEESKNFAPLREAGVHISLDDEWMTEALRVAKKRVVLKAHYRSPLFERYGFKRMTRPNIKFHYGVIEKKIGHKDIYE